MNLIGLKKQLDAMYIIKCISNSDLIEQATRRMGNCFIDMTYSKWRKKLSSKDAFKRSYSAYRAAKRTNIAWLSK